MLILSRKVQQKIIITLPTGEEIVIGIGGIDPLAGTVKVGIDAPRSITVDREEIHQAKMMEQAECPQPTRITKSAGSRLSLKKQ